MRMYFINLVVVLVLTPGLFALSLAGMDENCILSFVVPRDMMKSSCQLDDKVSRRLNNVEMKVNIYTQQVNSLQEQLDKQRQHDAARLDKLEQQLKISTSAMENNLLVERRLTLLEKDFEMLDHRVNLVPVNERGANLERPASDARTWHTKRDNSRPTSRESQQNDVNEINSSDENEPSRLAGVVSAMVKEEVKAAMENITKKFENYVRNQIFMFHQVFDIVNRRKVEISSLGRSGETSSKPVGNKYPAPIESLKDDAVQSKPNEVKDTLSTLPDKNLQNTYDGKLLHNIFTNESDLLVNDDILSDTNFSYSGDNPEDQQEPVNDQYTKITSGASSRISNPVKSKNATFLEDKFLEDNMIRDQQDTQSQSWIQDAIKKELTYSLTEVYSLFKKHTNSLESRINHHEEKTRRFSDNVNSQFKSVDKSVQTIEMQVDSLSQGFQDYSQMLNRIKPIETKVDTLHKQLNNSVKRVPSIELEEHKKKLKNLERLLGVYGQSIEHYRNETKQEYRQLQDAMSRDTGGIKINTDSLKAEMMAMMDGANNALNKSFFNEINELNDALNDIGLKQLDYDVMKRQLNGRTQRYDREIGDIEEKAKTLSRAQRDLRKRVSKLENGQRIISEDLNNTAISVFSMETVLKLEVLDQWLPMAFDYDPSRTECFGEQYVRRSNYKEASMVGVILCSPTRYKIFLAKNLNQVFLNIGDESGWGEDHCEFVRAKSPDAQYPLSPFKPQYGALQGYVRGHWGEEPKLSFVNTIKPTPMWYECGVSIP